MEHLASLVKHWNNDKALKQQMGGVELESIVKEMQMIKQRLFVLVGDGQFELKHQKLQEQTKEHM